jgi:hypothetical protein
MILIGVALAKHEVLASVNLAKTRVSRHSWQATSGKLHGVYPELDFWASFRQCHPAIGIEIQATIL